MSRSFLMTFLLLNSFATAQTVEILDLDIISYEQLIQEDPHALEILHNALHTKGIVGVRGVPGYKEKYEQFISASRAFHALPEEIKEQYKPNREAGDTFLGYEVGKEKFQNTDGNWIVDDLKTSYYALLPNYAHNKWPHEVNLQDPFETLGTLMAETGEMVMYKIGLLGDATGLHLEDNACTGRMLYYRKSENNQNPHWCGAHFDHGLFTVVLPAVYFVNDEQITEPEEAGLFVRTSADVPFKKIMANDLDVMMFQVGEFGQLVKNDAIRATEHRVDKAHGAIERYTIALFYGAPMDMPIYSTSILTQDTRYGTNADHSCTYNQWNEASFRRYLVQ